MDIKKLFIGGIVAGILYFGLGYLIYGNLLMEFMKKNPGTATGVDRSMDELRFLYLAIGNLSMGFLLAYVFVKSNVNTVTGGIVTGGIVGLLKLGFDCVMYGVTNILSKTAMAADICAFTVMSAIIGGVAAMVMGMGKKAA